MTRYAVKRRHYDGGESVIRRCATKFEAERLAEQYNRDYHADNYYVEEWKEKEA